MQLRDVPYQEQAAGFLGDRPDQTRPCLVNVTAAEKWKRHGRLLVQRASADPPPCCRTFKFVHLRLSFMQHQHLVASVWRPTVRARGTSWASKPNAEI